MLEQSETHRNKFEKGNLDRFNIKDTYFGDIQQIKYFKDKQNCIIIFISILFSLELAMIIKE